MSYSRASRTRVAGRRISPGARVVRLQVGAESARTDELEPGEYLLTTDAPIHVCQGEADVLATDADWLVRPGDPPYVIEVPAWRSRYLAGVAAGGAGNVRLMRLR